MSTWRALVATFLVAATLPVAAAAKEVKSLSLCGASGCVSVEAGALARYGRDEGSARAAIPAEVPGPTRFYRLELGVGEPGSSKVFGRFQVWYVPPAGLAYGADADALGQPWTKLTRGQVAVLREAARSVSPFPAPELRRVRIGRRTSVDPAPYVELLAGPPARMPDEIRGPVPLDLSWDRPNPWATSGYVEYLPRERLLSTLAGYRHVPEELAGRLEREADGLAPVAETSTSWALPAALAGGGLLVLGSALALLARRRRQGLPRRRPAPA